MDTIYVVLFFSVLASIVSVISLWQISEVHKSLDNFSQWVTNETRTIQSKLDKVGLMWLKASSSTEPKPATPKQPKPYQSRKVKQ